MTTQPHFSLNISRCNNHLVQNGFSKINKYNYYNIIINSSIWIHFFAVKPKNLKEFMKSIQVEIAFQRKKIEINDRF